VKPQFSPIRFNLSAHLLIEALWLVKPFIKFVSRDRTASDNRCVSNLNAILNCKQLAIKVLPIKNKHFSFILKVTQNLFNDDKN
jgi:hypothetical protein